MKNDQYFPHDATAGNNLKLLLLKQAEGARGYGVYWELLEFLRQQKGYRASMSMLDIIAKRLRTTRLVVERVVKDYNLFAIDGEQFFSPGLNKRMLPLDKARLEKRDRSRRVALPKQAETLPKQAETQGEQPGIDPGIGTDIPPTVDRPSGDPRPTLARGENDKSLEVNNIDPRAREAEQSIAEQSKAEQSRAENITSPQPSPTEEREMEGKRKKEVKLLTPPDYALSKVTHNYEGLMLQLSAIGIRAPSDVNTILKLSDFGRMNEQVWMILYHTEWKRIKSPARFLIAMLMKKS